MSKRNSQAVEVGGPRAAARRARAPGQAGQGQAAGRSSAARSSRVLAIAGGIGYAVIQANKPSDWEAAKDEKLVKPANTTGTNGTTVVIGKDTAKKTLEVYEDPRCPVCAQFEQTVGATVNKDVEDGKYKVQYLGATSSTATSAARAPRTRSARWAPR